MSMLRALGWFSAGLAATPLFEYLWHAQVAHGRSKHVSRESHLDHHRTAYTVQDPWQEMGENAPLVGRSLAAVGLGLGVLIGLERSVPLAAGLAAGYVLTTLYHARMHVRAPASRYEEWMWRFHWHHHVSDARTNFGLTNPVFDFLFGTAVVAEEIEIPERLRPAWLREDRRGFRVKHR